MTNIAGATGLIINEPLLWEKGRKGRCGISIPRQDVESAPLDEELAGEGPGLSRLERSGRGAPFHPAFPVELRRGHGNVSPGVLHHEVQP